ncbi:MAG TPA: zf-HC2 domain-containing protein [Thermoanaerobaculia bacterium]|jgi:anti-sigma factor RsiW
MIGGHVERELVAYHDGELPEAERQRVEAHVTRCARCRRRSEAIALSREFVAALPPRQMPAERAEAIRASLRRGEVRATRFPRVRWMAAAASVAVAVACTYLLLQPRVSFVPPAASPRSIERRAMALHREWAGGTFALAYRSTSPAEVRTFVRTGLGVAANLPLQVPSRRHELFGASPVAIDGGRGAAIAYRIANQPVLLLTSTELRDPPRNPRIAKRVEVRREPSGARILTWAGSDETYTLVVPRGVAAAEACAMCHRDRERLALIRRAASGV